PRRESRATETAPPRSRDRDRPHPSPAHREESMTIRTKWAAIAMSGFAALYATFAAAQTRFDHHAPGYVVPEKRVQISANVTDPKGVKLARVYFKTPAQADYVFVPMTSAGGARYVATVPAINASAPSLQYVLLAVSSEG